MDNLTYIQETIHNAAYKLIDVIRVLIIDLSKLFKFNFRLRCPLTATLSANTYFNRDRISGLTTNRYYDIYTEGNAEVTVRVKAINNRQNISLAESASQTTASFSKITVLLFLLAPYHRLCLHQLIM